MGRKEDTDRGRERRGKRAAGKGEAEGGSGERRGENEINFVRVQGNDGDVSRHSATGSARDAKHGEEAGCDEALSGPPRAATPLPAGGRRGEGGGGVGWLFIVLLVCLIYFRSFVCIYVCALHLCIYKYMFIYMYMFIHMHMLMDVQIDVLYHSRTRIPPPPHIHTHMSKRAQLFIT